VKYIKDVKVFEKSALENHISRFIDLSAVFVDRCQVFIYLVFIRTANQQRKYSNNNIFHTELNKWTNVEQLNGNHRKE
jgi:hypothetical protein